MLSRLILFLLLATSIAATALVGEIRSVSAGETELEFVWVPLEAPDGARRVEIGDFSGKHPKERKRSESIYAPFEQNGKRGYYLGRTEVTEEQWATVMGEGPRSKLPVTGKTYSEIQVFLERLNGMVRESGGIPRTPDGAEGIMKLPTEAEWEYAARGAQGPSYADQDPYGGDMERHEVFYLPGSDGRPKEVGSRPPGPLGLYDMLGNVRELMQENYSVGGTSGSGFLLKGGSYLSERSEMRSSGRAEHQRLGKDGKPSRRPDAGLRLCISAEIFTSLESKVPPFELISSEDGVLATTTGAAEAGGSSSWRIKKLGGRDYLPVTQIAAFYGLRFVPRGDRGVSLVSDGRSIDLRAGSREARIDRVKHWLSFPVIYFDGRFYVSRMDLSKTLDPLMRPHRIPRMVPVRTVVLDPGHGGHDRGAVNRYGSEKNYTLYVARRIRPYLQRAGLRVVITRQGDQFTLLERRPAIATALDQKDPGTVFVSIHFNASGNRQSAATGYEVFTLTPRGAPNSADDFLTPTSFNAEPGHVRDFASVALANAIYHAMLGRLPMFDNGVKRKRTEELKLATVPAVAIHPGFMTNPRDASLMADAQWLERLAESIAIGIIEFVHFTRSKKPPKLLARYQAEEAAGLAGTGWEYQPLAGIGAMVQPGFAGARGWRGLLSAPLGEEIPPYRLEFEPRGWAQLEAWTSAGEEARFATVDEQASLMDQGE